MESYTRAVYRVDFVPTPIYLRVGERSPELDRWLAGVGARQFAYLSAANPGSEPLAAAENRRRHASLIERLAATGLPVIAGLAYEAASGGWREESLLVAGIERAAALALAREFGQAALLFGDLGGPVELLPTPTPGAGPGGGRRR